MIAIIGAGISGLTAAYYLKKAGVDYFLLESDNRPGGIIKTELYENCLLDQGPNSLLCDEEILSFLNELNLDDEIVKANDVSKYRFIYKNGKYQKLPGNPLALLSSGFFSFATRIKIIQELFKKAEIIEDETLYDFFVRRFNHEVADYALNPFVSGIYAGDPKELLVSETFPILLQYEKQYGSILKGLSKNAAKRKTTINFKKGMQALPEALAAIVNVEYEQEVTEIKKELSGFTIAARNKNSTHYYKADKVIITTPSFVTASFLEESYSSFSKSLKRISYPSMCLVHTAYKKLDIGASLNGFGGLHPKIESRFTAGCIWNSSIFEKRCNPGTVLFTSFVGGSQYIKNAHQEDYIIFYEVQKELEKDFEINGKTIFQKIYRWPASIPQYNMEQKAAKTYLNDMEKEGLYFCSNWVNGVSVPDCIKNAKKTVKRILK